jgi:hypothetical protein
MMGHDPFRQTFMTVKIKKGEKVACLENNFLIILCPALHGAYRANMRKKSRKK